MKLHRQMEIRKMVDSGAEFNGPGIGLVRPSSLQILLVCCCVVSILDYAEPAKGGEQRSNERNEGGVVSMAKSLHWRSARQRATLFQFIKLPTELRTCKSTIPN